jgi:hypothetical protein
VIRTAEGDQVWGRDGLRASAVGSIQAVIVDVPAKVLSKGDFELSLGGSTPAGTTEEVGDYYFQRPALNLSRASPEMFSRLRH